MPGFLWAARSFAEFRSFFKTKKKERHGQRIAPKRDVPAEEYSGTVKLSIWKVSQSADPVTPEREYTFGYDINGYLNSITDPLSRTTTFTNDAVEDRGTGQLTSNKVGEIGGQAN